MQTICPVVLALRIFELNPLPREPEKVADSTFFHQQSLFMWNFVV